MELNYCLAGTRRRMLARVIDWGLYVIVGLGLVLVLVLGLSTLEVRLVELGDEGLIKDVDHINLPGPRTYQ